MTEDDPLAAAERLEASMNGLAEEIAAERQDREQGQADLRTYGRRNRAMLWGLVASIVLSLGLGVVAISASVQAKEATSQSKRNAEVARVSCEAGNETRRLGKQLWTVLLDLASQSPDITALQKQRIAKFRSLVETVYAPRDCDNSPTIPPGTVTPSR